MKTTIEVSEKVEHDEDSGYERSMARRRIEIDPDSGLVTFWKGGNGETLSVTNAVETIHEHGEHEA